jgi:hypothetical protein
VQFADGVEPGSPVRVGDNVILMHDVELGVKILGLKNESNGAKDECEALKRLVDGATNEQDRAKYSKDLKEKQAIYLRKADELQALLERTNADRDSKNIGSFRLKSPLAGKVLNWDFRENLTNRYVKPSDQLLRIGDTKGDWEVELKIPQKHIGQVLRAFNAKNAPEELDVDLLLLSEPTRVFKGKLARNKIAGEAVPNRDDQNESEPVVLASVRIAGTGIAKDDQIPLDKLQSGVEVHSKVRCGNRAMGYSLFYGVWEFVYEKVVFYLF